MIALCTDSNSQIPLELRDRYGVEVVPFTVVVDGVDHLEGIDLDADGFYARFQDGARPEISTAAPGPGRFIDAWERLAEAGATEILSIHIGSGISATCDSARLAAASARVPVRVVDTATASFGVALAVWEAGEALAKGADAAEAAAVAESVGARSGNVFVVQALDLARSGGRLSGDEAERAAGGAGDGIPVLSLGADGMRAVGTAASVDEAADVMARFVCAAGDGLRVGVGVADAGAAPFWLALEERLADAPEVLDLVRYRIGPSVGAHTGPGTAGAVFFPTA